MSILWKYLPPLASDYSGVASILFGMNSLNILYSPGSCDKSIVEVDEIRSFYDRNFFITNLNDVDIVVGIEKRLKKILKQRDLSKFDFISILGTPITSLTGVSLENICINLERELQIPVIFFETSGFDSYSIGVSKGLLKLAERLIDKFDDDTTVDQINIIGYTPLVLGDEKRLNELIAFLNNKFFKVNIFGGTGFNYNSMKLSSKAKLNLAITEEGVKLAKILKDKYSIPYILDLPVGITGMNNFLSSIEETLDISIEGKKELEHINKNLNYKNRTIKKSVLIVGEPFVSLSIKSCLQRDFGIKDISIISNIKRDARSAKLFKDEKYAQVKFLGNETEIYKTIGTADVLIADPIYKNFLPCHNEIKFIPIPYIGLSGREFAHIEYDYIGVGGYNYLKKYLEDI